MHAHAPAAARPRGTHVTIAMAVDEAAILVELRTLITPASLDGECFAPLRRAPAGRSCASCWIGWCGCRARAVGSRWRGPASRARCLLASSCTIAAASAGWSDHWLLLLGPAELSMKKVMKTLKAKFGEVCVHWRRACTPHPWRVRSVCGKWLRKTERASRVQRRMCAGRSHGSRSK